MRSAHLQQLATLQPALHVRSCLWLPEKMVRTGWRRNDQQ